MSTTPSAPSTVVTQDAALWCRRGSPPRMESMHRHNDIEINVVLRGRLQYVFAGRPLAVREGQIAAFWAAQPHGLIDSRPGDVAWVHVPLPTVLGWRLPDREIGALARMEPLVIESGVLGRHFEAMVSQWLEEYREADTAAIALLEIQAAIRRIIRAASAPDADGAARAGTGTRSDRDGPAETFAAAGSAERIRHAMEMAQFVVAHFRRAIDVNDVARSVHLTSSHAMTVFRRAVGVTIGEYIAMCRVAEAQRLLLTTTRTSADIASAAGFGSLSSFYAHITAACGMTPRQYRRQGR